jgi:hypothetical protein
LQSRGAGLRCKEELTSGAQFATAVREGRGKWAGGGEMGRKGKQTGREKMGHGENLGRRKREGEKEVGRGVLGQKGGGEGFGVLFFQSFSNLNIFKILFKTFQIILKLLKLHTITHKHHASKT